MSKILKATQMKTVSPDKKPNCLILDEIDGLVAGEKGAIKELLSVINAKDLPKGKLGKSTPEDHTTKKKKKGIKRRPKSTSNLSNQIEYVTRRKGEATRRDRN